MQKEKIEECTLETSATPLFCVALSRNIPVWDVLSHTHPKTALVGRSHISAEIGFGGTAWGRKSGFVAGSPDFIVSLTVAQLEFAII